jgi:predicted outer membrane repeat protein
MIGGNNEFTENIGGSSTSSIEMQYDSIKWTTCPGNTYGKNKDNIKIKNDFIGCPLTCTDSKTSVRDSTGSVTLCVGYCGFLPSNTESPSAGEFTLPPTGCKLKDSLQVTGVLKLSGNKDASPLDVLAAPDLKRHVDNSLITTGTRELHLSFIRLSGGVQKSKSGGSIYLQGHVPLYITSCIFDGCDETETWCATLGGSIYAKASQDDVSGGIKIVIKDTIFRNIRAKTQGGAINIHDWRTSSAIASTVDIEGSTFQGTSARSGGAVGVVANAVNVTVNILSSTFEQCSATGTIGGAIHAKGASTSSLDICEISIQDSVFENNDAGQFGGAISAEHSIVTLNGIGNIFTGNEKTIYLKANAELKTKDCVTSPSKSLVRADEKDNIDYDFNGCPYTCTSGVPHVSIYGCIEICSFVDAKEDTHAVPKEGCKLTKQIQLASGKNMTVSGTKGNVPLNALVASGTTSHFQNTGGELKINYVRLTNGISTDGAGSIDIIAYSSVKHSLTQIVGCIFSGSIGDDGGAINLGGSPSGGSKSDHVLNILDSTFENCISNGDGGAIMMYGRSTSIIENTIFTSNTAEQKGGALHITNGASVTFNGGNNVFTGNHNKNSDSTQLSAGENSITFTDNNKNNGLTFSKCPKNQYALSRDDDLSNAFYYINKDFTGCPITCTAPSKTFGPELAYRMDGDHDTWCLNDDKSCKSAGRGLSGNSCPACTPGLFQKDIGGAACNSCPAGLYQNENAGTKCKSCQVGEYVKQSAAVSCLICESGQFMNVTKSTRQCYDCPEGWNQMSKKSSKCVECPIQTFGPNKGWGKRCLPCERAFKKKSTDCPGCSSGKRIIDLTATKPEWEFGGNCTDCPIGWYQNARDQLDCTKCPRGYYAKNIFVQPELNNRSSCLSCQKGSYGDIEGGQNEATSCINCTAGRYSDDIHVDGKENEDGTKVTTPCKACPTGQWSDAEELVKESLCKNCITGRYSVEEASNDITKCVACLEGRFSSFVGVALESGCKSCPIGFAQGVAGQAYCLPCIPGTKQNLEGKSSCDKCDIGTFRPSQNEDGSATDASICLNCPKGFSQKSTGQASCLPCMPGTKQDQDGKSSCDKCGKGTFRPSQNEDGTVTDASSCLNCTIGRYQDGVGQAACLSCTPGQHQIKDGQKKCELCPVNTFTNESAIGSGCRDCPIGWKASLPTGSPSCIKCSAGRFGYEKTCQACPAGYARKDTDPLDNCIACNPSTYQNSIERVMCKDCVAGKYTNEYNSSSCLDCLPGFYRGNIDKTCIACLPGFFADKPTQTFCKDCVAGTYANTPSATTCSICSSITFEDQPRSIQCRSCQPKYESGFLPNEQRTACENPPYITIADCQPDEYLNNSNPSKMQHTCARCPLGADCINQQQTLSTLQPLPINWWHVPWSPKNAPLFAECPHRNRCNISYGGMAPLLNISTGCINNTGGPLCAVCDDHFYQSTTGICIQCTNQTVRIKVGVIFGLAAFCFAIVWSQRKNIQRLRAKYGAAWRDIVRILTINLSYCQVSSSLPSIIQIPWPAKYLEMLDMFSFVNIDIVSLLGFKCVGGDFWDFRGRLLLACFVPPLVVLACLVVYKCRTSHAKTRARPGTSSMKEMTVHSVEYLWDMFDLDGSGEIDEEEFHNLLVQLKASPEHTHPDNKEMRLEIMKDLHAVKRHHVHHLNVHSYVVLRPKFVDLAASGTFGNVLRDDWILWAEKQRIREHFLSDMLLVLFLLHAPLSQRAFYFFGCFDVGGRSFFTSRFQYSMFYNQTSNNGTYCNCIFSLFFLFVSITSIVTVM